MAASKACRTPSLVARGRDGADRPSPARRQGRADVRAQHGIRDRGRPEHRASRAAWLEWKRRDRSAALHRSRSSARRPMRAGRARHGRRRLGRPRTTSTARSTATASTPKGEVCGVTTTSGLAWKIPGRLGDSPILGAGLYVDGDVGAAGSTGRGEANLYNLCSFLIVEEMRRGKHPKDAGMEALKRIKANTIEKRLLNSRASRTSTSTSTSSTPRASTPAWRSTAGRRRVTRCAPKRAASWRRSKRCSTAPPRTS